MVCVFLLCSVIQVKSVITRPDVGCGSLVLPQAGMPHLVDSPRKVLYPLRSRMGDGWGKVEVEEREGGGTGVAL